MDRSTWTSSRKRNGRRRRKRIFERLQRWLSGTFTCIKCGRKVHALTFGYGTTICPDCYEGEENFLILDENFLLNRLIARFTRAREQ